MTESAELATIEHLYKSRLLTRCDKYIHTAQCIDIKNTMQSKSGQGVSVMAKLPKSTLKRLYNEAREGSTKSMKTISMLYVSGFGLVRDESKALDWTYLSLLEPASISFNKALSILKSDIKNSPHSSNDDEYIYPETRNSTAASVTEALGFEQHNLDHVKSKLKKSNPTVALSPILAGVRVTAIYRVSASTNEDCHLYDVFFDNGSNEHRFALEAVLKLGTIPSLLGEIRNKQTSVKYPSKMNDTKGKFKYFAVKGFLVVPDSKKSKLSSKFPEVRNTKDLVDALLKSVDDRRIRFIPSEDEFKELKSKARALREKARKYKDRKKKIPTKLKIKFSRIKQEADKLKEFDAERKFEVEHSYPENFLDFVAVEIVGVSAKDRIYRMNVKPTSQSTHLQSLGFKTLSHPGLGFESASCSLKSLTEKLVRTYADRVRTLYNGEYKVSGVLLQPNVDNDISSRKNRHRYVYKIN